MEVRSKKFEDGRTLKDELWDKNNLQRCNYQDISIFLQPKWGPLFFHWKFDLVLVGGWTSRGFIPPNPGRLPYPFAFFERNMWDMDTPYWPLCAQILGGFIIFPKFFSVLARHKPDLAKYICYLLNLSIMTPHTAFVKYDDILIYLTYIEFI